MSLWAQPLRLAATLVVAGLLAGCGLMAPRGNDGFADLDSLGLRDVDNTLTLSIGPSLLRFAARHVEDEPEVQQLLRDLDGVRVRIFEIDRNPERVAARIKTMSGKLRAQDWQPVMVVQEEGEQAHVLLKQSGDRIQGLTVITSDGREAVIVNVMGHIRPERFTDTMLALDIDAPPIEVASSN